MSFVATGYTTPSITSHEAPGTAVVSIGVEPALALEIWIDWCSLPWPGRQEWILLPTFRLIPRSACGGLGGNAAPKPRGLQSPIDRCTATENTDQRVYCRPSTERGIQVWRCNRQTRRHLSCAFSAAVSSSHESFCTKRGSNLLGRLGLYTRPILMKPNIPALKERQPVR